MYDHVGIELGHASLETHGDWGSRMTSESPSKFKPAQEAEWEPSQDHTVNIESLGQPFEKSRLATRLPLVNILMLFRPVSPH
jgi:hypothetical protein